MGNGKRMNRLFLMLFLGSTLLALRMTAAAQEGKQAPVAESEVAQAPKEVSKPPAHDDLDLRVTTALYNDLLVLSQEEGTYSVAKRFEALRTSPTAVTLLSSEHFHPLSVRYIPQALRLFPGIDVLQITRTEFTVSIRGFANRSNFRPRDTLVLVDGRTVYDDFSGSVEWETLDIFPQDVSKIEVIRGAGSAVYGANAARGVINIFTSPPPAVPTFELDSSFSGRNSFRERIAAADSSGAYQWKVTGGYDKADVWDNFADLTLEDDEAAKTWRFNTLLIKKLPESAELRFGAGTNTGNLLQTTTSGILIRNDQVTSHARVEYESRSLLIRSFWNYRQLDSTDPEFGEPAGSRRQNLYDLEVVRRFYHVGRNTLTIGGTLRFTTVLADSIDGEEGLFTSGVFVDEQYNLTDMFVIRLAGRLDHHEEAGYQFSPRAGIAYQIAPEHTVRASYSVGYRNPTLSDNFLDLVIDPGPDAVFLTGNRKLTPEESTWYEANYMGKWVPGFTVGIDLFYVVTENFIRADFVPPATFTMINSDEKVEGGGGEVWGQYQMTDTLRLLANYGFLQYHENGVANEASPKHKVNVGFLMNDPRYLSGALIYRFIDDTNWPFRGGPDASPEQQKYYSVDLLLTYLFTPNLGTRLEIYNLTDRKRRELPLLGEEIRREVVFTLTYRI